MGNQGIHQMDIARWFLGEHALAPRSISIGGRLGYEDAGNTPNTQIVYLDYPAAPLIFETRGLPRSKEAQSRWGDSMDRYRGSQIGVIVQCEKGYVLVPSYIEAIAYDNDGQEIKRWSVEGDALGRHIQNFLSSRRRERSIAAQRRHPGRPPLELALPPGRHLAPARQDRPAPAKSPTRSRATNC